ncbi:hypothetical protein [Nonomuraea dietziae]|uniref:Uncharacterized protein n=1 Tax=Nonomuraea dietziae TaxID=65515 RepID=A0A7W5Y8D9_9ACTN|nr:hypothetical protein [Nonomuraea dietziae]MBB3724418.1 hypothetical protein [Nonomuraea dietziae]
MLETWTDGPIDPAELVRALYGRTPTVTPNSRSLHRSGWRDTGSGLLDEVVDRLHAQARQHCAATGRRPPTREAIQLVAGLHQAVSMEPLFGDEFRRSVGLEATARDRMLEWWIGDPAHDPCRTRVDGGAFDVLADVETCPARCARAARILPPVAGSGSGIPVGGTAQAPGSGSGDHRGWSADSPGWFG